jgi:hypothetical protein
VGERLGVGVGVRRGDAVGEAAMAVGVGVASGGRVRKTPTKYPPTMASTAAPTRAATIRD